MSIESYVTETINKTYPIRWYGYACQRYAQKIIPKNETESENVSAQPATSIEKESNSLTDVWWPLTLNRRLCKWRKQRTWLVSVRVLASLCRDVRSQCYFYRHLLRSFRMYPGQRWRHSYPPEQPAIEKMFRLNFCGMANDKPSDVKCWHSTKEII